MFPKRLIAMAIAVLAIGLSAGAAEISGDADRLRIEGWIKTFSTGPAQMAGFEAPDYHASLIEQAARKAMVERLEARGFEPVAESAAERVTFSVSVKAPKPKGRRPLPKSPVRIASEDRNPFDNIYDPELRPEFVYGVPKTSDPAAPVISVVIYARRGDERIWSGYAGAPLGAAGREAIVRSLVGALIDHFGDTIDQETAEFFIPADAPPAIEIR